MNGLLDAHIDHVSTHIRQLKILERELKALREKCAISQNAADCGFLSVFEKAARIKSQAHSTGKHAGHIHGTHGRLVVRQKYDMRPTPSAMPHVVKDGR